MRTNPFSCLESTYPLWTLICPRRGHWYWLFTQSSLGFNFFGLQVYKSVSYNFFKMNQSFRTSGQKGKIEFYSAAKL